jgi:hypothetical protein
LKICDRCVEINKQQQRYKYLKIKEFNEQLKSSEKLE